MAPQRAPQLQPYEVELPRHLRVVAPSEHARRRLTPAFAVILTAGMFATLLAVAVAHTLLVQGQVRLDGLDQQLTSEQLRYQQLRQEVAVLESPTRVVAAAHAQGMVTPDDLVYLQPPAPEAPAAGSTTGDVPEPVADPPAAASTDRSWSEVKPMLETPNP